MVSLVQIFIIMRLFLHNTGENPFPSQNIQYDHLGGWIENVKYNLYKKS